MFAECRFTRNDKKLHEFLSKYFFLSLRQLAIDFFLFSIIDYVCHYMINSKVHRLYSNIVINRIILGLRIIADQPDLDCLEVVLKNVIKIFSF
jgi:hypothetical protein